MLRLNIERGHVSATVAAGLLGVSRQRVNQLLKAGRIPGAFLMDCGDKGEVWCVPRKSIDQIIINRNRSKGQSK